MLTLFVAFWVFFSGVHYTRLQFNTGVRYMAPMIPFLFVPAMVVLMQLPRVVIYGFGILSVAEAWALAMHRDVERGMGVLNPILHVFRDGLQLPALTTLSRIDSGHAEYLSHTTAPLLLLALAAAMVWGIWRRRPHCAA